VAAQGPGGNSVSVFDGANPDLGPIKTFTPYGSTWLKGIRVATADFDHDGYGEIITGAMQGGGPHVEIWKLYKNGALLNTPELVSSFYAYSTTFSGGVDIAAGHVFGSNNEIQLVTSSGPGAAEQVKVWTIDSNFQATLLTQFQAYTSTWTGGANVSVGNFDGIGPSEIVVGAMAGGGPAVQTYSLTSSNQAVNATLQSSFYAMNSSFTGGVDVASTNFTAQYTNPQVNTQPDQLITGAGPTGAPRVQIWDLSNPSQPSALQSFYAYDSSFAGGIHVG
jgi:hypothetical protein